MFCLGIDWGSIQLPSSSTTPRQQPQQPPPNQPVQRDDPERIRLTLLNDPHQLSLLKERNPELAGVINDPTEFQRVSLVSLTKIVKPHFSFL